jgi:lipopolysaccharide/colanic/teichoic acid biosynthesis glycosyltransferase
MTASKRALDLVLATSGLCMTMPFFAMIALGIALTDGRPIFFRQHRVGHRGALFRIWKFRTMRVDAERSGGQLTVASDPRITQMGQWLRKLKLDELPQLLNVLSGEMTLVGPRPEVPRYTALYNEQQRGVLDLVPGITDPASIKYCNENEILESATDSERCYVDVIMPEKIALNLDYAQRATLLSDIGVILSTLRRIVAMERGS